MDDPVRKTWSVQRVTMMIEASGKSSLSAHRTHSHIPFPVALQLISQLERNHRENTANYTPLFPEPPHMGFEHFKAFAEREGYIFDREGQAHPRPHPAALPDGIDFPPENVASADRHVARSVDDFTANGHLSKLPNTLFVLNSFNRVAARKGVHESLAEMRVMDLLERFVASIDVAHAKMDEYCRNYQNLGQGHLMDEAQRALLIAETGVKQMKAYGVETREFESFVAQCRIAGHIVHAQALFDLMRRQKGDFDDLERDFKLAYTEAVTAYSQLDPRPEALNALKAAITHAGAPALPPAIRIFIDTYREQKTDADKKRSPTPPPPRP